MKARLVYPLLFFLPSAMLAVIAAVLAAGAGAGVLWLFVFGDDEWPAVADTVVMTLASLVGLFVLAALLLVAHLAGKRFEAFGGVRRSHVLIALGLSLGLPLLVLWHQWQVGNLGGA